MRPIYLKVFAIGLLAAGAMLVMRQSLMNDRETSDPRLPANASRSMHTDEAATLAAAVAARKSSLTKNPVVERAGHSVTQPDLLPAPVSNKPPVGIRLADDVQLPAVIIALGNPNRDPDHPIPTPIADAMQGIVDTFYQELAESVRGSAPAAKVAETGSNGDTVVIQPGPAVDKARKRANEMYRAMFGDDAFNQVTMNSALEVRLPVDPASEHAKP